VESLYLGVVQQAESSYTFAALARVAYAYRVAAHRLSALKVSLPSAEERREVERVLQARAQHLSKQSDEVLGACAERVLQLHRFDKAARSCLASAPPEQDPAIREPLDRRRPVKLDDVDTLRSKLAANPNDTESLATLGERYLKAGDFHAARLVLGSAVEAGGGPDLLNQLGLAAAQAGDVAGALEAFSRAAAGGHPAASRNFAALLQKVGLPERAATARKAIKGAAPSDQLLPYAR